MVAIESTPQMVARTYAATARNLEAVRRRLDTGPCPSPTSSSSATSTTPQDRTSHRARASSHSDPTA